MSRPDHPHREQRVLLCASPLDVDALGAVATDFEIETASPTNLLRRAARLRPRVVVWTGSDAPDGLRLMTTLRTSRPDVRLLLVTPPEAVEVRLAALGAGVDDVVTLPLSPAELAARVRLLLRRARPPRRTRLAVGEGVALDLDRRQLLRGDDWVHLRPKEAGLLELFARSPGRVFTRGQILERVWGPNHDGDPRTVDVHVRWLRAKIEPDPHAPVWLLTVRGVGYRLEPLPLTER